MLLLSDVLEFLLTNMPTMNESNQTEELIKKLDDIDKRVKALEDKNVTK